MSLLLVAMPFVPSSDVVCLARTLVVVSVFQVFFIKRPSTATSRQRDETKKHRSIDVVCFPRARRGGRPLGSSS